MLGSFDHLANPDAQVNSALDYPLRPRDAPLGHWAAKFDFDEQGYWRGPRMKCGWGRGARLTGRQMRAHFRAWDEGTALRSKPSVRTWKGRRRALHHMPKRPAVRRRGATTGDLEG